MCLDIDPGSVIHKHLNKKISNTIESGYEYFGSGEFDSYHYSPIIGESYGNKANIGLIQDHNLTMLPSFHISLGAPPPNSEIKTESVELQKHEFHELIGMMSLADINISKNTDKTSAWISINDVKFSLATRIIPFSYMHSEDLHLHISLANLTGEPRDSIARPEDCIIDTITT